MKLEHKITLVPEVKMTVMMMTRHSHSQSRKCFPTCDILYDYFYLLQKEQTIEVNYKDIASQFVLFNKHKHRDQIKENKMSGACSIHGRDVKSIKEISLKN